MCARHWFWTQFGQHASERDISAAFDDPKAVFVIKPGRVTDGLEQLRRALRRIVERGSHLRSTRTPLSGPTRSSWSSARITSRRLSRRTACRVRRATVRPHRCAGCRQWARSLDLRLLIQLQAWRLIGFAFIALSANNLLAETFAVPAALGDTVIAVTALFMAEHVVRRGATALFYAWTAFGILDLVVAVTLGFLQAPGPLGILHDKAIGGGVVDSLPVVLIPTFVVPLMIILHLLSLTHVRSTVRQP